MMLLAGEIREVDRWIYIWASYGISLAVFVLLFVMIWRKNMAVRQSLKDYYRRQELLNGSSADLQEDSAEDAVD